MDAMGGMPQKDSYEDSLPRKSAGYHSASRPWVAVGHYVPQSWNRSDKRESLRKIYELTLIWRVIFPAASQLQKKKRKKYEVVLLADQLFLSWLLMLLLQIFHPHPVHATMNSMKLVVVPLHFISLKKTPNDAVLLQRQSQFTPKIKANAVPRLLSSLV